MNLPVSPSTRILSGGVRALAHVIVGLESLGVVALFVGVLLGLPLPDLPSDGVIEAAATASGALIVAYLLGLIVDGLSTTLWAAWVREDWGDGDLKPWARRRSRLDLVPSTMDPLDPWIAAQRWIWESERANREFGDLRLRMMLGKDTALNVAVAIIVCAVALFLVPFREAASEVAGTDWWRNVATRSVLAGALLSWLQLRVVMHPRTNGEGDPWEWCRSPEGVTTGIALVFVLAAWAACWVVPSRSLARLPRIMWLAPATAFGPLLFFGFAHVRITANALYHQMVRDAYEAGAPGEGNGPDP